MDAGVAVWTNDDKILFRVCPTFPELDDMMDMPDIDVLRTDTAPEMCFDEELVEDF